MRECSNKRLGRLIALYEYGALEEKERRAFQDHLVECEFCYDQVYSLEPLMRAVRKSRAGRRSEVNQVAVAMAERRPTRWADRVWRPVLAFSALALLAVASAGVLRLVDGRDGSQRGSDDPRPALGAPGVDGSSPWADLRIPPAVYEPSASSVTTRGASKAFERAMAAYQRSEFASAAEQLQDLADLKRGDGARVRFYLGVSQLLDGRALEAISSLREAAELGDEAVTESSRYYLAFAYLKGDQVPAAIAELDAVIAMDGEHRWGAERLRQQIAQLRPESFKGDN